MASRRRGLLGSVLRGLGVHHSGDTLARVPPRDQVLVQASIARWPVIIVVIVVDPEQL